MFIERSTLALKHVLATSFVLLLIAGAPTHAQGASDTQVRRLGLPGVESSSSEPAQLPKREVRASSSESAHSQHNDQVRTAVGRSDWQHVLSLTAHGSRACPDDLDLWARGRALEKLERLSDLEAFYRTTLGTCSQPNARRLILEGASYQLPEAAQFALLEQVASLSLTPDVLAARDALESAALRARVSRHIAGSNWSAALAAAEKSMDRAGLVELGWSALEDNPRISRKSFDLAIQSSPGNEEARYGAALAAYQLGDLNPALAYRPYQHGDTDSYAAKGARLAAMAHLDAGERARASGKWKIALTAANTARGFGGDAPAKSDMLTGGILLDAAQAAYDAGNFEEARAYAVQAAAFPTTQRDGAMRAAWADLQLNRARDAEKTFRNLYRTGPDEEAAEGLVLAAAQVGGVTTLGPFAEQAGGPLLDRIMAHRADTAYAQKNFLLAEHLNPGARHELKGVNNWWVSQAISSRNASGTAGEGRVDGFVSRTSFGWSRKALDIEAGIAAFGLDAGQAGMTASVGTPGFANDASDVDGIAPFLHFRREDDSLFEARLATTPLNGPVTARAIGEASIERRDNGYSWKATAFSNSVDETMTSFTGRVDPASGTRWGRIVETGLKLNGRVDLRRDLALVGGVTGADLSGHNVESNTHVQAQLGLPKNFKAKGFDYLAAGPFYQFDSYDRNTNFHTVGHGGYFSPQSFHRAGLSVNLQTEEARDWMARADLAVAYEDITTDSALVLPLSGPIGPRFAAGKDSGVGVALQGQVARRVTNQITVSASTSVVASSAYDDVRIGVALRYTPGGRSSVLSRDLRPDLFNRDIW